MSKTFKSVIGKSDSRRVHIESRPEGPNVWISDNSWVDDYGITIATSDAPALALAILEAAGVESPYYNLKDAVDNLRQHVEREAQYAAEAEAQAKLEAEALELFQAWRKSHNLPMVEDWDMTPSFKPEWLAVARRAREMRAEK